MTQEKDIHDYTPEDRLKYDEKTVWPLNLLLWEIICLHELYRRSGFLSEDIYVVHSPGKLIGVALSGKDGRDHVLWLGKSPLEIKAFMEKWKEFVENHNAGRTSDEECNRVFKKSIAGTRSFAIIKDLVSNGFIPPALRPTLQQPWGIA